MGRFGGGLRSLVLGAAVLGAVASAAPAWAQTEASAYTTGYRYDAARRLVGTISPSANGTAGPFLAVRNSYDAAGRLTKVEKGVLTAWKAHDVVPSAWGAAFQAHETFETSYDAMSRKTRELVRDDDEVIRKVTQYSYDALGRLQCTAVRMDPDQFVSPPASACSLGSKGAVGGIYGPDRITRNYYDAAGQLTRTDQGVGTAAAAIYARYTYSANGKRLSVTDARGYKATYHYDGHDRMIAWAFPSKANGAVSASCTLSPVTEVGGITAPPQGRAANDDCEKYGHDRNGNRAKVMKRDGQVIVYTHDALNRVTAKAGSVNDVLYTYDLRGLQLSAKYATSGEAVSQAYDGFGRLTSATTTMGGTSRTLTYTHDVNGNRTSVKHPDNVVFGYGYDGLDRVVSITEDGPSTAAVEVATIAYDAQGRRQGDTRGAVTSTYGYDGMSRLESLTDGLSGTTHDVTTTYKWNPAGQITEHTRSNDAYAYDGLVNVDRTYTTNPLNQYVTAGPATFCHDLNGNLTSDGTTVYQYDTENRLIWARAAVSSACPAATSGALRATLTWDPLGRLYQTTGTGAGSEGTVRFLYDGDELVAEYNASGTLIRRYVHGPGADDPILWYEGAGVSAATRRALQVDHQGSIVSIASASNGALIAINAYDEYGAPNVVFGQDGSPIVINQGRFQYTGQAWLKNLGMYHYKARIYSPYLGRFLQTDPIGYEDQINLYAYVANDPVGSRDPTGTDGGCIYGSSRCSYPAPSSEGQAARQLIFENLPIPAIRGSTIVVTATKKLGLFQRIGRAIGRLFGGRSEKAKPDWVGTPNGNTMRPTADAQRQQFRDQGLSERPASGTSESGTIHTTPDGRTDVRVMDGGSNHPPRAVTTRAGTNDPVQPNGQQFPNGTPRQERRDGSHEEFPN